MRLHLVASTNSDVEFVLDGQVVPMQVGELWSLDLHKRHRGANRGATPRVHLVLDCVVNDWLREQLSVPAGLA